MTPSAMSACMLLRLLRLLLQLQLALLLLLQGGGHALIWRFGFHPSPL